MEVIPGTPAALSHHSKLRAFSIETGTAGVALANIFTTTRYTGTEHDEVNNIAIIQVVVRFAFRSQHRKQSLPSFIIHGIASDSVIKIGVKFGLVTHSPTSKAHSRTGRLWSHFRSRNAVPMRQCTSEK